MICRTFTVPTPKGTYFQKLRDQKTGTVRELRVYLYTEHFRNRENGNMPSHKSKAIGVCVSVEDTSRMYPNDNYFELVDTTIHEAVLQQRRTRDGRKNAPAAGPSAKAGVQGQRSSLIPHAVRVPCRGAQRAGNGTPDRLPLPQAGAGRGAADDRAGRASIP
ncbi:MAG TPA: hypothetical protein H9894_08445 [Candidatus Desulfovibrio intestinipullorum]|uniref:Uncharacterized protein n=1 Tax=Candidatus Desulfovibrio intestinipullorum TaxID=2838536 RepID=A0A9D1PZ00_9BACT|nr:hypothetical protein [Candidatus Desulfovibrio intestinipullorum]